MCRSPFTSSQFVHLNYGGIGLQGGMIEIGTCLTCRSMKADN